MRLVASRVLRKWHRTLNCVYLPPGYHGTSGGSIGYLDLSELLSMLWCYGMDSTITRYHISDYTCTTLQYERNQSAYHATAPQPACHRHGLTYNKTSRAFVKQTTPLYNTTVEIRHGDLNGDGKLSAQDLLVLLSLYGLSGKPLTSKDSLTRTKQITGVTAECQLLS